MKRLSEEQFWGSHYSSLDPLQIQIRRARGLKWAIKSLLGPKLVDYMRSYEDYFLWDVLYPRYLPKSPKAKALEVGSAPGDYLVRLSKTFGYIPFGIEYTKSGAELNRKIFALNNIDPSNVTHGDLFSDDFQDRYKEFFDLVISRGFIEHFDDIEYVLEKHMNLLRNGGYLLVNVPNFRGIYYIWLRLFRRKQLEMHNLRIMKKEEFTNAFRNRDLTRLYCDYYGTFCADLFYAEKGSPLRLFLDLFGSLQPIINLALRVFFKNKGRDSKFFSPYLLFIGIKKRESDLRHQFV